MHYRLPEVEGCWTQIFAKSFKMPEVCKDLQKVMNIGVKSASTHLPLY